MDILLVVLIIVLMQSKERKVKINRIWLIPALLCFVTIPVHYSYGTNNIPCLTLLRTVILINIELLQQGMII
ncbi:hypothetical protein ACTFPQ_16145 [Bacillus cereus group sp. MYBK5-1]|uniref:hypothetical protein n=1 Tax=Bacillus cereus group sp. MYBK5-1 TaxID=3450623 RepID=UPI003F7A1E29